MNKPQKTNLIDEEWNDTKAHYLMSKAISQTKNAKYDKDVWKWFEEKTTKAFEEKNMLDLQKAIKIYMENVKQ